MLLAAFADAQGQYGGSQATCSASQKAVYIGCYDITSSIISPYPLTAGNSFYPFQITPYPDDYMTQTPLDLSSYVKIGHEVGTVLGYADYVLPNGGGDFRNSFLYNSITPSNCTIACRGHGYAYSALVPKGPCICGTYPPLGVPTYKDGGPNNKIPDSMCRSTSGCAGDYNQNCGNNPGTEYYAPFYVDQSFPYFATISKQQTSVGAALNNNNYKYMGCFSLPADGTPNGATQLTYTPPTSSIHWPYDSSTYIPGSSSYGTILGCFQACALLGFPFAGLIPGAGGTNAGAYPGISTYEAPFLYVSESC